ncbi:MAG: AraC family transcriptional regulator [Clostridiales bacterium]|nr:AraC family transcriptional regulator [Clostridiales bacterium]
MFKRMRRREFFVRNVKSFIIFALIIGLLLSVLSSFLISNMRHQQYYRNLNEKMGFVLEDIRRQIDSAEKTALQLSITNECNRRIFSQNKYYEIELTKTIKKYKNVMVYPSDYFLIYTLSPSVLYHVDRGNELCQSTFSKTYFESMSFELVDQLITELLAVNETRFISLEFYGSSDRVLLVCPFYHIGNKSEKIILAWIINKQDILSRIELVTGGVGESYALADGYSMIAKTEEFNQEKDSIESYEQYGLTISVDVAKDPLFNVTYSLDKLSHVIFAVGFMVLIILAIGFAIYNYKPVNKLVSKYKQGGENDLEGLDQLISSAYQQMQTMDTQYMTHIIQQRTQVLLLLLNGIYSDKVMSALSIMQDSMRGPLYAVIAVQTDGEDISELIASFAGESDSATTIYECSWEKNNYYLVLSMLEDHTEDTAILFSEWLKELNIPCRIGVSNVCSSLPMLNGALKQARARLRQTNEVVEHDDASNSNAPHNELITQIIGYIQEHAFEWSISLSSVADQFDMNQTYLSELFKRETKTNFSNYLSQLRIEKAKDMLLNSTMSIAEVSQEVGYNSLSYFIKTFKKYVDMTPGQFRNQVTNESNE